MKMMDRLFVSWCHWLTGKDYTVSFLLYKITSCRTKSYSDDLSDVSYHIAVKTGDVSGGSSDSKVFVKLYGERGDTSRMMLAVSDNNLQNYFETGRVDIFTVDTCDIGQVCVLYAVVREVISCMKF